MNLGGSGFGSFGSSGGGFGTGSSLFSSQPQANTGGGGLFGSAGTTQPQTTTTGGLFGSAAPATQATSSPFSFSAAGQTTQTVATGTGQIKFVPLAGQDTITKNGVQTTISTSHQCITAMKEYESKSLEELRLEDYQANRKFATTSGGFGTTSTGGLFGSTTGQTSGGFGSTTTTTSGSLFGASNTQNKPLFGAATTTTTTGTTGGLFGSAQNKPLFGGTTTTAPATTSAFGFGSSQGATTGAFGATTQPAQQQSTLFGGIGQSTPSSGSIFGSSTTSNTGTGLFGSQQQNKPLFPGFGTQNQPAATTTTSAFGGAFGSTPSAQPSTSIFGNTQSSPLQSVKPFGSTTTTTGGFGSFGATTAAPNASPFGQTSTQPASTTGGGIFGSGASTAAKPFGSTLTSTGTGFGSFGSTTTQPTTGQSLFGGGTTGFGAQPTTTQATSSPFGSTGLGGTTSTFGAGGSTLGGGIFGSGATSTTTQPSTGGIFGSQPTQTQTTTSFGGSGGLGLGFGQTQQTTQQTSQPQTGIFGSTSTGSTGLGGGIFGSPSTATNTQSSLTAQNTNQSAFGLGGGLTGATTTQQGGSGLGFGSFGSGITSAPSTGLGLGSSTSGNTSGLGIGSGFSSGGLGLGLGGLGSNQAQNTSMNQSLINTQQFGGIQTGQTAQQAQSTPFMQQQLAALSNSPYGPSSSSLGSSVGGGVISGSASSGSLSLLRSDLKEDMLKPVSPAAQRPYITEATSPQKQLNSSSFLHASASSPQLNSGHQQQIGSDFKGGLSHSIRLTPKPLAQISLNKKSSDLFEGVNDEEETPCFMPRKNVKKLIFKPNHHHSQHQQQQEVNASRRSSTTSSVNGDVKADFSRKAPLYQDESINYGISSSSRPVPNNQPNNTTFSPYAHQITNDLTEDEENQRNGQQAAPHPANIVLDRPGYFTIPSLQDLAEMYNADKGECLAENFAIGRVDYGCITFPGITDVANMNLDELVHIRRKEVHVYPDESKKPPVGHGLNKPAEITLHRIWPTDKHTRMPITDPHSVIGMAYDKKIEKATNEMGAQFVDYDPVTGSWTFKVKHFSKYGLAESDDESDSVVVSNRTNMLMNKPSTASSIVRTVDAIDKESETGSSEKVNTLKQDKDMIQKQLKLIEMRRMELMQPKKTSINTITNQEWEKNKKTKAKKGNEIRLEISDDDSSEKISEDEDADETGSGNEDKENNNQLYPSLRRIKKREKSSRQASGTKLYPDLENLEIQQNLNYEAYSGDRHSHLIETDDEDMKGGAGHVGGLVHQNDEMEQDQQQQQQDLLPFTAFNDRMMLGKSFRPTTNLLNAFFPKEEARDEFYHVGSDDESRNFKFGFNQKPIAVGLLKRNGLGGMGAPIAQDKSESMVSIKTDQSKAKTSQRLTTISITTAETMQKIGVRALKLKNPSRSWYTSKAIGNEITSAGDLRQQESLLSLNDRRFKSLAITNDDTGRIESKKQLIEMNQSVSNGLQWCLADAGLFNARRFRSNFSLYPTSNTYTRLASPAQFASCFRQSVRFCSIHPAPSRPDVVKFNSESYLNTQYELSEFHDAQRISLIRPKLDNEIIRRFSELSEQVRNRIGDHPDADNAHHAKQVWTLCQSLWGDLPDSFKSRNDSQLGQYEIGQIRKRLLGDWLSEIGSSRISKQLVRLNKNKEAYLQSVFGCLTVNRVLDACSIAIDNLDMRLALLMSQTSSDQTRSMIKKQISEWFTSQSDKFINQDRLKLYVLISGQLTYNLSGGSTSSFINVCDELDWKRQFALHLWYHSLPINGIADSLRSYEQNVQNEICKQPVPPYIEDTLVNKLVPLESHRSNLMLTNGSTEDAKKIIESQLDTCFHLIKLFCDSTHSIEDTVSPQSHTSNQLDFRLSWHLAMALLALGYKHVSRSCLDTLHESYAAQLQSMGLWHWSLYVLMHIEDETRRETVVRAYLSRSVTSHSDLNEHETFVINKLHVPAEWVYEYKALRAKYENLHDNQLQLLLKAKKWNEAHVVLTECLAADLFIKHNFKTLYQYLRTLSKESQSIDKWSMGGQIYLDFLNLKQQADQLFTDYADSIDSATSSKTLSVDSLGMIQDQLFSLSSRLKEFADNNKQGGNKKLLCSLHMSKLLLKYFNILGELESRASGDQEIVDDVDQDDQMRVITRTIVEKADRMTQSVPDKDLIGTMLLKKQKYMHESLMSKARLVSSIY